MRSAVLRTRATATLAAADEAQAAQGEYDAPDDTRDEAADPELLRDAVAPEAEAELLSVGLAPDAWPVLVSAVRQAPASAALAAKARAQRTAVVARHSGEGCSRSADGSRARSH